MTRPPDTCPELNRAPASEPPPTLERRLHLGHLATLGVNAIVGTGIFLVPGQLAHRLGAWSVLAFPVAGLLLNCTALTYARLARLTDRNGGPYLYAEMAFGPRIAFLMGWVAWITAITSCSAVGDALGFYLSYFVGAPFPFLPQCVAVVSILIFGAINYRGVSYGGRTMVLFTVLKLLPLVAIALAGLRLFRPALLGLAPHGFHSPGDLSAAVVLVLFTLSGFEAVPVIAGETSEATVATPRAVLVSLWLSIFLYTAIQIGILAGPAVGSAKPLADQAQFLWGPLGGAIVACAGILSILGFLSGDALSAPRFLMPLAEDGHLPEGLARIHPRFHTPSRAIVATILPTALFAATSEADALVALASLAVVVQYLLCSLALLQLCLARKTDRPGIAIAGVSIAVCLFLLLSISARSWLVFLSTLGVGIGLRAWHLSRSSRV